MGRPTEATWWILTAGFIWSHHEALLVPRIVPAAERLPYLFTSIVNQVAQA